MFQFSRFASNDLCIQSKDTQLILGGFPHSEISGSKAGCRLPGAYRRLQRLSSPPIAKASAVCAYSLDHKRNPSCPNNIAQIFVRLRLDLFRRFFAITELTIIDA